MWHRRASQVPERSSKWYVPEEHVVRPLLDIQTEELAATFAADDAAARSAAAAATADTAADAVAADNVGTSTLLLGPRDEITGMLISTAASPMDASEANGAVGGIAKGPAKQKRQRKQTHQSGGGVTGPAAESRARSSTSPSEILLAQGSSCAEPPADKQKRRSRVRGMDKSAFNGGGGEGAVTGEKGVKPKGEKGAVAMGTTPSQLPKRRQRPQRVRGQQSELDSPAAPPGGIIAATALMPELDNPARSGTAVSRQRSRSQASVKEKASGGTATEGKPGTAVVGLRADAPEYPRPAAKGAGV